MSNGWKVERLASVAAAGILFRDLAHRWVAASGKTAPSDS
jgi:hypothetical protein